MKIYCYGDSNTYGYDPRGFFGDRYEASDRWPDLLEQATGYTIINDGVNGREFPNSAFEYRRLSGRLAQTQPEMILVMLGSNDASNLVPEDSIRARAKRLLCFLKSEFPMIRPVVIGPVREILDEPRRDALQAELAPILSGLAETLQLDFVNADDWQIPLAFDRSHYTEEGHHLFAQQLKAYLDTIIE